VYLFLSLVAFFTSGIFYGWASLYTMFLEQGVYSEMCGSGEDVCEAQKARLSLVYTVSSTVNLCSQLFWGCVLDWLGPRVCNMWSTFLVMVGFVLLSLSSRGVMDGFLAAMVLIAGAGPGAQISLFHLSELFEVSRKSTVLSTVTGAFQLGFVVFLLLHWASTTWGLSLATLALLYCLPLSVLLLAGGVLWPDRPCIPPGHLDPLAFTTADPEAAAARERTEVAAERDRASGLDVYKQVGLHKTPSRGALSEDERRAVEQEALRAMEEQDTRRPIYGADDAAESQPLVTAGESRSSSEASSAVPSPAVQDYGSLPDPQSSPSLHYSHRALHALRAAARTPNLKGQVAGQGFCKQLVRMLHKCCNIGDAMKINRSSVTLC